MRVLAVGAGVISWPRPAPGSPASPELRRRCSSVITQMAARRSLIRFPVSHGGCPLLGPDHAVPMGELCFAAHSRHAQAEMRDLAAHLVERIGNAPGTGNLRRLLSPGVPA